MQGQFISLLGFIKALQGYSYQLEGMAEIKVSPNTGINLALYRQLPNPKHQHEPAGFRPNHKNTILVCGKQQQNKMTFLLKHARHGQTSAAIVAVASLHLAFEEIRRLRQVDLFLSASANHPRGMG